MRKTKMNYPLNIQFFAEGGEPGAEGNDGVGNETKTFDDLLAENKDFQSEFDKKVAKALETQESKFTETTEQKIQEALEEQKRLAGLDDDAKAKEIQSKKDKEFQEREATIAKRELEIEVKGVLADKGLSQDLLDLVVGTDLDTSNANIETLQAAIATEVEKNVASELGKSGAPGKQTNTTEDEMLAGIFKSKY